MDDRQLASALARDVDRAFPSLVVAHEDRIYTIAYRLLAHRADAEEAAQDAFVRAYRALVGYEPERIRALVLRPWLATIAINACRNRRRRTVDRRPAVSLAPLIEAGYDPRDPGPSVEMLGERQSEVELWARRLAALPRAQRTAIVLRHVDGLSYPEIATALDLPEGTVKAQVHRGLRRLREHLVHEDTPVEIEHLHGPEEMTA